MGAPGSAPYPPQSTQYQPSQVSPTDVGKSTVKRKFDPKNPLNEEGKIKKGYPKYFEVLGQAQKVIEYALRELQASSGVRARNELEQVLALLNKLEE